MCKSNPEGITRKAEIKIKKADVLVLFIVGNILNPAWI
jgi:hypothetical protein